MCVIGPTRMSYADAIGGVRFLSAFMSRLMLDFYGGGAAAADTAERGRD